MPKLIRVTTVPMALKVLLRGQMRYMKKAGFDVIMVSAEGKELEDVLQYEDCPHHLVPMTRKITPVADTQSLWKLYRFLKKEKPDIVHSHTPKAGLIAMLAAKFAGVKIRVHTIAGLRFMTATGFTRKILIRMEKITANAATHVWPNSMSLLKYVQDNKLVKAGKLEVIGKGSSNGIDLTRFSKIALSEEGIRKAKETISYDPSLTYILSVGRIVKDKGISELAKAFVSLYRENDKLRLVLVGTFEEKLDPLDESIMRLVKTHPGIILAGWHDEVEYFMSIADILVHPSYREGFPNVVLQAGAMECPVVCSRIEGNIDIVDENIDGLVFTAKDENDLYQKLKQAIAEPAAMKQMAVLLRKKIEENFDRTFVQEQLRKKYEFLLKEIER
ncbi:MAG: glycosyltransferase family 4 protein [Chitinophagaceae bacterium]